MDDHIQCQESISAWNTSDPVFQECLEKTVIPWTPCALLLLGIPLRLFSPFTETKNGTLRTFQKVITAVVGVLTLGYIGINVLDIVNGDNVPTTLMLSPVVVTISLMMTWFDKHQKDQHSNSFLKLTWIIVFLAVIVRLFLGEISSMIFFKNGIKDIINCTTLLLYFILVMCDVIRSIYSEVAVEDEEDCINQTPPESRASLLSLVTFNWISPLIWKAQRRTIERRDLWPLMEENKAANSIARFEIFWTLELEIARKKQHQSEEKGDAKESRKDKEKPWLQGRLLVCLCKTYGPILLLSAFYKLLFHLTDLIFPSILRSLILITTGESEANGIGYFYAFLLFAVTLSQAIFVRHHIQKTQEAGMRCMTALTVAIYKKTLKLSNAARKATTVGENINLISVDAGKLSECMWCVNDIWAVPLLFCLSFYCLWQLLGISVLVGFVIIVLLVPLYLYLVRKSKALHETKSKLKDSRMKIMNEILNGIQVLKIYAWENSFEKQISDVREKELEVIGTIKRIDSCIHLICTTTPFLMSLLIFSTYVLIDSNNMVTADTAFVAISYFSILNWTMIVGAHTITNLLQGSVSLKRIENFFGCEELDDEYIDRHLDCKYGIAVTEGTFTWDKKQDPTIKNININVPDGSLVAVVGSVGSGKSSLLSAMLGEMECVSGKVNIKGKIAYVAQQAWIMNTTLQKNILFGDDLNQKRYNAIIDATTLRKDLDIFAGGDQTEIGEKGINLSGGQKQRVSLARAVYQDADIYLFDDPLSAVDSHVGKHIFEEVIGPNGLLKNKTRVLVTHGISFLPKVDKIITLVEGQIGEVGSFKELIGHNGAFAEYLKSYMIEELTCGNTDEEIEALAITEQLVSQMDNKGNEAILKRQLSDIAHHKRTECESATISHSDTNSTGGREIRIPLSRAHSRELMRQSSNIESEHLDQFIMKHNVARQKSKHFSRQMSLHIIESSSRQIQDSYLCDMAIKTGRRQFSFNSKNDDICTDDTIKEWRARHLSNISESAQLRRQLSRRSSETKSEAVKNENLEISKKNKFIQDETVEVGTVKLGVLMAYAKAIGFKITVVIILVNILHKFSVMSTDIWLSKWTNDNTTSVNGTVDEYKRNMNLGMYAILGILQGFLFFFAQYCIRKATLISTRRLHLGLLRNILRSPISFFDTVPVGRIVNRFSKDIQTIDDNLLQEIVGAMLGILYIICDVTVISSGSFYFVIAIIPLSVAYFYLQRLVTKPLTQLRRMESAARSPIFSYFSETISGCTTIRAFRQQTRFMGEIGHRCEELDMCHHLLLSTLKWLHIRNEIVGGLIVFFTAFFTIINKDMLSPGLVGLTLMYALNVTLAFRRFVWFATSVESQIVSVERIKEYSETPTEAEWVIEKTKPKKNWPDKGCIEFTDYAVRYKEGLDLVLKGITCHIKPCEKIGIVGRTGAGKSSLTRALFRIIESARGTIKIDGIDIATIGLHDLRSKITIIPQDPVLFSGTLRMNLDPFEEFSNDQLWQALEHAHLKTFVSGLKDGLDYHCSEGGENLSVGQRQLICLARALLRKSKILVLDEATAAVDLETDDLIQNTIRREFDDCTILTIAHRLNTIIDYTRIMVLDFGLIKEFDTPTSLLQNSSSMFYGMAKDAGLV